MAMMRLSNLFNLPRINQVQDSPTKPLDADKDLFLNLLGKNSGPDTFSFDERALSRQNNHLKAESIKHSMELEKEIAKASEEAIRKNVENEIMKMEYGSTASAVKKATELVNDIKF